jgi:hypothetical protein
MTGRDKELTDKITEVVKKQWLFSTQSGQTTKMEVIGDLMKLTHDEGTIFDHYFPPPTSKPNVMDYLVQDEDSE